MDSNERFFTSNKDIEKNFNHTHAKVRLVKILFTQIIFQEFGPTKEKLHLRPAIKRYFTKMLNGVRIKFAWEISLNLQPGADKNTNRNYNFHTQFGWTIVQCTRMRTLFDVNCTCFSCSMFQDLGLKQTVWK